MNAFLLSSLAVLLTCLLRGRRVPPLSSATLSSVQHDNCSRNPSSMCQACIPSVLDADLFSTLAKQISSGTQLTILAPTEDALQRFKTPECQKALESAVLHQMVLGLHKAETLLGAEAGSQVCKLTLFVSLTQSLPLFSHPLFLFWR